MDLRLPILLFLGENLFGRIQTYGYETPWADGELEACDKQQHQRFVNVCELLDEIESWPDYSCPEEEDKAWQTALLSRGITQEDSDHYSKGPWSLQTQDGNKVKLSSLPMFNNKGYITWRW